MSPLFAQPTQLFLDIPSDNQQKYWQESQEMTHSDMAWKYYLNRLFLDSFLNYVEAEYSLQPQIWKNDQLKQILALVDGTAIIINNQRFVLLATEIIDDDEVTIPQEWIDIPSWVGDYYLIAQINSDEQWIRVKGYTTHGKIKTQGTYNEQERLYHLDGDKLIEDLSILWLSLEFCPEEITRTEVHCLPNLAVKQAENLIIDLANSELISPRLTIPFSLWGALLENDDWRDRLYKLRSGLTIKLSDWFNNLFDNLWEKPENLNLQFSVSRNVTESTIKRAKLINLGDEMVILIVEISQETSSKFGIRIQLYSEPKKRYLPANIRLTLLSLSEQILKSIQASNQDNYIAINKFSAPTQFIFKVKIELESLIKIEQFML